MFEVNHRPLDCTNKVWRNERNFSNDIQNSFRKTQRLKNIQNKIKKQTKKTFSKKQNMVLYLPYRSNSEGTCAHTGVEL